MVRFFLCTAWLAWVAVAGFAQTAPPPDSDGNVAPAEQSEPSAKPAESLDNERRQLADRLLVAERTLHSLSPSGDALGRSEPVAREVDLLKQLDTILAQRQSATATGQELRAAEVEVGEQLVKLRREGLAEERPYSFLLLDSLVDQLKTAQKRAESLDEEIEAAGEELDRAKSKNDELQAERRRLKEATKPDDAAALAQSELESSIAEQLLALRRAELENAKTQRGIHASRIKMLEESVARVRTDVTFWQSDLQRQLVDVGKEESDVKQEIESAQCALQALDQHWNEVRVKLAAAVDKSPGLVEEEKAAKLARDCHSKRIAILQKELGFLALARQTWKRRFTLARGSLDRAELKEWGDESERDLGQIDFERQSAELRLKDCRKDLADLDERTELVGPTAGEVQRWLSEQHSLVDQLSETYNEYLTRLEAHDSLLSKLFDELEARLEGQSLWERLTATGEMTSRVWNHELAEFDDHSVTVGKAVWGLGLLVFGVLASRWLTGRFARRLLGRFGIEGGAAVAFESLAYYVFVAAWGLAALRSLHVPLTVFAFMGGAVAIGVGFGCQKILNNFISGVILLVEQPIRVGDVIEIGGLQGTVQTIGTRSTLILTGANSEIVIPNSAFLESSVVNWTLGDSTANATLRVVIARTAGAREASRVLERAAGEHGLVYKSPAPVCWFAEFGDHGLVLELHYWLDVRNRPRVASDLRFLIDQRLRDAGIELAPVPREITLAAAGLETPPPIRAGSDIADLTGDRSAA